MNLSAASVRRHLLLVLMFLVLLNAFVAGFRTVADSDMGWHLATGRYIVEHRHVPDTDVLSYPSAGKPWIYPPLAQVLLYLVFRMAGYSGLSWLCALVSAATIAVLLRSRSLAASLLALCAVAPVAFRMLPRPDLFTALLFALLLSELLDFHNGARARLWLLPLVMLLWVNIHPGFIAGLAVFAAYLLIECSDLVFADRRRAALDRLRRAGPWMIAAIAATLINPWATRLYSASLELAGTRGSAPGTFSTASYIGEFLAVPLSTNLLRELVDLRHPENGFVCLMAVALVVIAVGMWRRQFGGALVQAAALYLSIQHARYIGLFCIVTVIFGATLLSTISLRSHAESAPDRRSHILFVLLLVFASAVALLRIYDFASDRTYVVFRSDSRFGAGESSWFPQRAAQFIQREQLPGNIFEEYAVGGFAAWRLGPKYPDFIDGRADHLDPALLVTVHDLMSHSPDAPSWREAADRWNINGLLISEAGSRAIDRQDALAYCRSSAWRPVYMDEVSLVLLRDLPANRPWIDRLQVDCLTQPLASPLASSRKQQYDFYLHAGELFFALRRDHEAEDALLHAAALYPYDPNAQLSLAQLYQRERMFDKAEAAYHASLARNQTDKAWYELGRFYALTRRLPEAEQAISNAARLSVTPFVPYIALGEVQLALNRPQMALRSFANAQRNSPYRGAESVAPDLNAQIAAGRARANLLLGKVAAAIEAQQEAVRLTPNVALRWNQLADILAAAGQREQSEQARQHARELNSSVTE